MVKKIGLLRKAALLFSIIFILSAASGKVWAQTAENDFSDLLSSSDQSGITVSENGSTMTLESAQFTMNLTFGLNGNYRYGAQLPLAAEIESKEGNFEGTFRVIIPVVSGESDDGGTAYEGSLMLTEGEPKKMELVLQNPHSVSCAYIQIENAKGKIVFDKLVSLNASAGETALVGILSDDYTSLGYFDKASIDSIYYSGKASILELSQEMLPESADGLEALSFLVINSYDTSRLSEAQQEAILCWIREGGALILGTGADYKQTLSMFSSDMLSLQTEGNAEGTLALQDAQDYGVSFTKESGILALRLENDAQETQIMTDSSLVWKQSYGKGTVLVTAFNLGINPVASWDMKDEMADQLLSAAAGGYSGERIEEMNYGDQYFSTGIFSEISLDQLPDVSMLLFLLLVFAGLCPFSYLILKKMNRREWIFLVIPAEAIVITGIILIMTADLRIRYPMEASVTTIVDSDSYNTSGSSVEMRVLVPNPGEYALQFSENLTSFYKENDSYWTYGKGTAQLSENYDTAVKKTAEGYWITVNDGNSFSSHYYSFKVDGDKQQELGGTVDCSLNRTVNGMSGTVTNNTDQTLKGVSFYMYSQMIMIGTLEPGESRAFTEADNEYFYDMYSLNIPDMDADSTEYNLLCDCYANTYNRSISYEISEDQTAIYLLAFAEDFSADYMTDENIKEDNVAVYEKEMHVGYSDYPNATVVKVFEYADCDGSWDSSDGQMYALTADTKVDVHTVTDSVYLLIRQKDSQALYGDTYNTKIYAYNYDTDEYEEIFTDGATMEFDGTCPYMKDGIMQLEFTCQTEYEDYVPFLTLIGGKRIYD